MKPFEALESANRLAKSPRLLDFAMNIISSGSVQCIYCGRVYWNPIEVDHLKHNRMCLQCEDITMDTKEKYVFKR